MAEGTGTKRARAGLVTRCWRGGLCPVCVLLVLTVAITGGGLAFVFLGKSIWKNEKHNSSSPDINKPVNCGDFLCEISTGENCTSCPEDCGECFDDFFTPSPPPPAPDASAPSPAEDVPVMINGQVALDLTPRTLTQEFGNIRWQPNPQQLTMVMKKKDDAVRWHSKGAWQYGNFTAQIRLPKGDINGLVIAWYFASELTDVSNPLLLAGNSRDEVDFEFITRQTADYQMHYHWQSNVIVDGVGINKNEEIHITDFDTSADFHEYKLTWTPKRVEWLVDGQSVRVETKIVPKKPMYMLGSMWQTDRGPADSNRADLISWGGLWTGTDAPYDTDINTVMVPAT